MAAKMFCSDVELGKFLGSATNAGVITDAYQAILDTSSTYKLHTRPSGIKVLAFNGTLSDCTNRFLNGELELVSSEDHKVLKFISTKVNPKFSINKTAVGLFDEHNSVELSNLLNQPINEPLVITGRGLGGYLAFLFTLLRQHVVDEKEFQKETEKESKASKTTKKSDGSKTTKESEGSRPANPPIYKRPICITFGTPLLGDENLQLAISKRPEWESRFLNIVSMNDPFASLFTSSTRYKPFGTFFFCTESGGRTAFKDQARIMVVLDAMALTSAGNNSQMYDYEKDLGLIRKKVLYRGPSELGGLNLNSLRVGIESQFMELCLLNKIPDAGNLIKAMENKQKTEIKKNRSKSAYEPSKKLNDMKISLTYMELYMECQKENGGYYDGYKNAKGKNELVSKHEIIIHQRNLNNYWKGIVEEKNLLPQKETAKLRTRWLFSGNNARRIVEPLVIAEHYTKPGNSRSYIEVRPENYKHYILLEKWYEDDKKAKKHDDDVVPEKENDKKPSGKKEEAANLTDDSCFLAHVEDALILLNGGKIGTHNIEWYEEYFRKAIDKNSVSLDIFLKGSSFMKWWNKYKAYKGGSYDSDFTRYMNKKEYEK